MNAFSSNLPIPTAEEGSSEGAGEGGIIAHITILIHQNRDLNQNLEKEKLVKKTEIATLNDELITTKKKIDELNIDREDLNSTKKRNKEVIEELAKIKEELNESIKYKVVMKKEKEHLFQKVQNLEAKVSQREKQCKISHTKFMSQNDLIYNLKCKLDEFSPNLPIPTAEERGFPGTGEIGLITQLTNLINQNRDLKRKVNDAQQLVQNLKKDKLKDTTEIARLNDELMTTKKKIDEVNKKYEELNNFKKKNEELNRSLCQLLTSATEKNISLRETQEILENKMNSLKLVLVTTKKTVEKLDEDKTLTFDILQKKEETLQNLKGISCEDILAEINKGLTEHSTSCNLQKQKLKNAENKIYSLEKSNNILKDEISTMEQRMEQEYEENEDGYEDNYENNYEDDYEDEHDPIREQLERERYGDLNSQLDYFHNLCSEKDAKIMDLSARLRNLKRRKYSRRFQRH